MPDFPQIGCSAVAQYPSSLGLSWPTVVQRSVDGSEQRFVRPGEVRRSWRIRLERLTESDAQRVADFFRAVKARATPFRFQDPWTSLWHDPCWFDSDELELIHRGDDMLQGELRISTTEVHN